LHCFLQIGSLILQVEAGDGQLTFSLMFRRISVNAYAVFFEDPERLKVELTV